MHNGTQEHNLLQYDKRFVRAVGHLLGLGCATLLSLMDENLNANLRCSCNSPPGRFFSYELATHCS